MESEDEDGEKEDVMGAFDVTVLSRFIGFILILTSTEDGGGIVPAFSGDSLLDLERSYYIA